MKTITSLTATEAPAEIKSAAVLMVSPNETHVTQSQKGFWRRIRVSKNGLFFESSAAGSVFVSHADLWNLAESHDINLKTPAPIKT